MVPVPSQSLSMQANKGRTLMGGAHVARKQLMMLVSGFAAEWRRGARMVRMALRCRWQENSLIRLTDVSTHLRC